MLLKSKSYMYNVHLPCTPPVNSIMKGGLFKIFGLINKIYKFILIDCHLGLLYSLL